MTCFVNIIITCLERVLMHFDHDDCYVSLRVWSNELRQLFSRGERASVDTKHIE